MGLLGRDTVTVAFRTAPFLAFLVLGFVGFEFCLTLLEQASSRGIQKLDIHGHRGGRGDAIENTLPSFAWGLINGVTTLELDNGITKDGVVVVWHDQSITSEKCQDTTPAFAEDPDFPYVGKLIVNLTLAQIRTLDCGSKRLKEFQMVLTSTLQLFSGTYPGTKISTLREVFAFARCADPERKIYWNIESKINASHPVVTHGVDVFVEKQHAEFISSLYPLSQIIYQSLDWRTLIAMKDQDIRTHLIVSENITVADAMAERIRGSVTAVMEDNSTSPWQAGIRLDDMPGLSLDIKIANAAHSIKADILSPAAETPTAEPFTTQEMVDKAHELDMQVIPWTVNSLSLVEKLTGWMVDGIITDHPNEIRRWARKTGYKVEEKYEESMVLECLERHLDISEGNGMG